MQNDPETTIQANNFKVIVLKKKYFVKKID